VGCSCPCGTQYKRKEGRSSWTDQRLLRSKRSLLAYKEPVQVDESHARQFPRFPDQLRVGLEIFGFVARGSFPRSWVGYWWRRLPGKSVYFLYFRDSYIQNPCQDCSTLRSTTSLGLHRPSQAQPPSYVQPLRGSQSPRDLYSIYQKIQQIHDQVHRSHRVILPIWTRVLT
jgi:hypothetical protein